MIKKVHEIKTGSRIIGIHGKAGAGKDTISSYLHANYENCWRQAFADPLKAAAAEAFGIPYDFFNDVSMKELTNEYWNITPRKIAQFMGTEMFRNTLATIMPDIANDFWIQRLAGTINGELNDSYQDHHIEYNADDTICITDVRFQNEVDFILENSGYIIHIIRSEQEREIPFSGIPNHPSEQELNLGQLYFFINNNESKEQLYETVDKIADQLNLVRKAVSKFDSSNF